MFVIGFYRFRVGDVVRHFKYETLSEEEKKMNRYTYQIDHVAKHTETGEDLVIYHSLYGSKKICARPMDMFISEVDHAKYPNIKQKYRFEVVQ